MRNLYQNEIMRMDKRKARADSVAYHIMHRISEILYAASDMISSIDENSPLQNLPRRVHEEVLDVLMTEGIEVLTDYDRMHIGLPARDPMGWTDEEIKAYEKRKLDIMLNPSPSIVLIDSKIRCPKCGVTHND